MTKIEIVAGNVWIDDKWVGLIHTDEDKERIAAEADAEFGPTLTEEEIELREMGY